MLVSVMLVSAISAQVVGHPPVRACPPQGVMEVSQPALLLRPQDQRGDRGAQTLGSMPKADLHQTVLKFVGGCALSTVVREDVQGDGRFAKPR